MIRSIPLEPVRPPKDEATTNAPAEAGSGDARVAIVTLGCAKNIVDSEIMAGLLAQGVF